MAFQVNKAPGGAFGGKAPSFGLGTPAGASTPAVGGAPKTGKLLVGVALAS